MIFDTLTVFMAAPAVVSIARSLEESMLAPASDSMAPWRSPRWPSGLHGSLADEFMVVRAWM